MRAIYNNIEIMDCRCQSVEVTPDYDPSSGKDFMRTRVRLVVSGVVNPASMAYVFPGLVPGTRAGLTIVNIRQTLQTPRRLLQVFLGPDLIFVSPGINPVTGQISLADSGNGPLPHQGTSVVEGDILGDRTVIVRWGVDFWIMGSSNIVLSNRWSTTHHINRNAMTTRTIRGQAVVRADAIANGLINNADDFRAALIVPQPLNFRRDGVDVTCSEDGTMLNYTVVDKETGNSLGKPGQPINVFFLDGNATAGWDMQVKSWHDRINLASTGAAKYGSLIGSSDPAAIAMGLEAAATWLLTSFTPRAVGRCMCRVEGGRNVPRITLGEIARNVCIDRAGANTSPTSLFFTQHLNSDDGQAVETRMEWMPNWPSSVLDPRLFRPNGFMNMSDDYRQGVLDYPNAGRNPNNPLPRVGGTRGSYVQQMAQQALMTPQQAPPNPPAGETSVQALLNIQ